MSTSAQDRSGAIDVLRVWAMLGVVASHATVSYLSMPTPEIVWVVRDRATSGVFDIFFWVSGVLLSIFFLIGGYAAASLYDRSGASGFLRDRGRRLLASFLLAGFIMLPLILYVWAAGWWLDGRCTLNDIRRVKFAPPIQDNLFGPVHLWFLEYLLIYTAAYWIMRTWFERWNREVAPNASRPGTGSHLGWFVAASTLILLVDVGAVANLHNSFIPAPARLLYHGVFFTAGALWLSQPGALQRLTSAGLSAGLLWLPVFACTALLFRDYLSGPLPAGERVLLPLAIAGFVWLSVFGCFGLAYRASLGRWAGLGILGAASYWVYIVHFPIVGATHLLLSRLDASPLLKFPCVVAATLALSLWSYRKLVQGSALAAWLGWTKAVRARPAEPAKADASSVPANNYLAVPEGAVVEIQDTSHPSEEDSMRRHVSSVALVALIAFAAPARAGVAEPGFVDTQYVGGLAAPTAVAFLPDGTLLIAEKGGNLKHFDGVSTTTLVSIPVCTGSEMGLLGIAIDPNFGSNGFIYLYRTKAGGGGCGTSVGRFNQVVRVTMSGGTIALGSLVELLDGIRTDNGNHDGGVLRIGPDGKLWVGAGDSGLGDNVGGPGSASNPYAQDLGELNGKVLRLNLDGTAPADNPFVGMLGAREEVWAYGFRNPFRMSFDGATGKLWIADVGDLTVEEVDIGTAGGNYSWPRCEGDLQGPPLSPLPCVLGGDVAPVFTYPHSGGSSLGTCIIGGDFAGAAFGGMAGNYVFGDCTSNVIYHVALNAMRDGFVGSPAQVSTNAGTPSDFVVGPDGAIYYAAVSGGDVRRLAGLAEGVDTLLTGKRLSLRDNPAYASRKSISISSKDAAIDLGGGVGSTDDPTLHGGSLRVVSVAGGFDNTYPLPAIGWTYIGQPADGKGYRYKDTKQVNGPVKAAIVRNGKMLRAAAKGMGLGHTLAANPDPVSVVVETGTKDYCMTLGGTATFKANTYFKAKFAAAPGACPP